MGEAEIKKYQKLNEFAEQSGIVIFGGSEDRSIPVGELCQAFAVESKMYNRSFSGLHLADAINVYEKTIAALAPETLLIHMGEADMKLFGEDPAEFDKEYIDLLSYIKSQNKKCRIAVVSLRNYEGDPQIADMNKHLRYIADSEKCEYGDIASKKVWNPQSTMDTISFVGSIGFVEPLKNRRPLYNLVRMCFCCEI